MRRIIAVFLVIFICFGAAFAAAVAQAKPKFILMISEQNIEGPQKCWWASQVDLSVTEATVAQGLIRAGYEVIEPSVLNREIVKDPAFKLVDIPQEKSIKLGRIASADYVITGKALASAGGNAPQSNMRSCFANITAKLIRIKDGKVIAYLDAAGSTVHMDVITGGREALKSAGEELSGKILQSLKEKEG